MQDTSHPLRLAAAVAEKGVHMLRLSASGHEDGRRKRRMRVVCLTVLLACAAFALALPAAGTASPARAHSAALGSRVLTIGEHGSDVRELQLLLRARGYRIAADGSFGPATLTAVKSFQRSRHLAADGLVGPATIAQLRGRAPATSSSGGYVFPLRPASLIVPTKYWTLDQGVDIPTYGRACGSRVVEVAIAPGTVVLEGINGFGPYAPVIHVDSGPLAGRYVYYGHAAPALVRVGTHVTAGQPIAEVGCGRVGISNAPHLEIGVSVAHGPVCCPRWGQTASSMYALVKPLFAAAKRAG
jgi:murein DD-endopeptidase MepM/ murein hydrolase activator NlpD